MMLWVVLISPNLRDLANKSRSSSTLPQVRDLWAHADLTVPANEFTAKVPDHGVVLRRLHVNLYENELTLPDSKPTSITMIL